jgi:two-component system chemotaxis sensor kinase CheA
MEEEFIDKFKEEAAELINHLETALLALEETPEDNEQISLIFRVMHSLKGNGAMFGYDNISRFTHDLETIYDLVKTGKLKMSKDLFDLTLESIDVLKHLLLKDDRLDESNLKKYNNLMARIIEMITLANNNREESRYTNTYNDAGIDSQDTEVLKTYYISFVPDENIFDNGTNPLYLLDELSDLGINITVGHFEKIPLLENYLLSKCYAWWEVILATKESEHDIRDIFMFVEDDCKLEIKLIASENLFNNNNFKKTCDQITEKNEIIGSSRFDCFIDNEKPCIIEKEEAYTPADVFSKNIKETAISSIRVASEKIDDMLKLISEMITIQSRLSMIANIIKDPELLTISEHTTKITKELRDNAFKISLIPINTLQTRYQRLVRDLSAELGKDVIFEVVGGETELDKKIVETLTEPVLHILRNSIDHGIEDNITRKIKGKPEKGKITLYAYYSGANVVIQIKDDGAGIDVHTVRNKAIERGLIAPNVQMSDKDILNLIFMPGFSTAEAITDVSGRGVGMDVVKRKIGDIRGEVEIDSVPDEGTTITLKLPLTLSIIDGLLIKIGDTDFIIPLSHIYKIYPVNHTELNLKHYNLLTLDGVQIPFYYLRDEFNVSHGEVLEVEEVVVVYHNEKLVGLVVDRVTGEYQAVVKPLGKLFASQEIISGATILGDGSLALVMDTNKIIQRYSAQTKMEVIDL